MGETKGVIFLPLSIKPARYRYAWKANIFWETAHLPSSKPTSTYFSLKEICWLRGRVGGQFPKNVKWCNIKWADLRQSLKETSPNQHLILALYIFFAWFHHSCLIPPLFQSHVESKLLCLKGNRKENLWNYHLAKCSSNDQCVLVPAHVICLLLCLPRNLVPQDQLPVLFWSYEKFSKFLPSPTPSPLKVPNPKSFSGLAC